jgi:hypothetical protein
MILRTLLAALALGTAFPAAAQTPPPALSLEQKMQLRCATMFAIVADEQRRGVASALGYPPLAERGREYFVRTGASLMDAHGLSREQIDALARAELQSLQAQSVRAADAGAFVKSVMEPCLLALDASGL